MDDNVKMGFFKSPWPKFSLVHVCWYDLKNGVYELSMGLYLWPRRFPRFSRKYYRSGGIGRIKSALFVRPYYWFRWHRHGLGVPSSVIPEQEKEQ
jgi:hypothetical protein